LPPRATGAKPSASVATNNSAPVLPAGRNGTLSVAAPAGARRRGGKGGCSGYCTDLANDFDNCGGCGNFCEAPGPYEYGACVDGVCVYQCVEGAGDCGDGTCTYLGADPDNCGACGNVCAGSTPYCNAGTCGAVQCFGGQALCSGVCTEIQLDPSNCGGCGVVCGPGENCAGGLCQSAEPYWGE
jgi:hypothetical protein